MSLDTRTALLDAAQERFSKQGFAGTSMRELATAVGIRESSIYKHFTSKHAIFQAVLARAEQSVVALASALGMEIENPDVAGSVYEEIALAQLVEVADAFFGMWLHDPNVANVRRLLTIDQYRSPEAARLLRELTFERPIAFQAEVMAGLMERGAFEEGDPMAAALAFWGPVMSLTTLAEDPARETEARRLLLAHVEHFHSTHRRMEKS